MRNDDKKTALLTLTGETDGHIDDLEITWLLSAGATSNHINDAWMEIFLANGATSTQFNTAAYEFLTGLGYTGALPDMWAAYWAAGGGIGDSLAFHALAANDTDYEVKGVLVGTGDLTEARTSSIYLPNHEDVYRVFGSGVAGYQGGRVETNLAPCSNDFDNNAYWAPPLWWRFSCRRETRSIRRQ